MRTDRVRRLEIVVQEILQLVEKQVLLERQDRYILFLQKFCIDIKMHQCNGPLDRRQNASSRDGIWSQDTDHQLISDISFRTARVNLNLLIFSSS